MNSVSLKVAACIAGGLLFLISGCGPTAIVDSGHAAPDQVETNLDSTPTPGNEQVATAKATATLPGQAPTPTSWPGSPSPTPTPVIESMPIPAPDGPP